MIAFNLLGVKTLADSATELDKVWDCPKNNFNMTDDIKAKLYDFCVTVIEEKLSVINSVLDNAQDSANHETKSTAGDKHDTSRELLHQERNKAAQNLNNQLMKRRTLIQLNNFPSSVNVGFGSLLNTNQGWVFIGLSIGNIQFNEEQVLCVSPISPFAKAFEGASQGDCVEFNNTSFVIETII